MSKKTIGLNPLEEYLSAPKNKKKDPEKAEKAVQKAEPVKKQELKAEKPAAKSAPEKSVVEAVSAKQQVAKKVPVDHSPSEKPAPEQPSEESAEELPQELRESVEVDGQGQLAIKGTRVPKEKVERPSKQRITLHISAELVDRVKNAVYWEPGLTVAGFAEEAFTTMIEQLEEERGAPFPQRKHHRLRGGRPVN